MPSSIGCNYSGRVGSGSSDTHRDSTPESRWVSGWDMHTIALVGAFGKPSGCPLPQLGSNALRTVFERADRAESNHNQEEENPL
jgi:hypothetical protein